jgi:pimeloyl-ACP methyl ester carboxylesterase
LTDLTLPPPVRQEFPFESKFFQLSSGHRMHYVDQGQGQPFLFVHGNPTWAFLFRRPLQHFSSSMRTIAADHIGCGLSDKPQDFEYRLEQHIDHLEELVLSLDLQDIRMMVHDWGGAIGLGVAGRHPERFSQLVINNTAAFHSQRMPWLLKIARTRGVGQFLIRGFNAFAGLTPTLGTAVPERVSEAAKQGYLLPYDSWRHRVATYRFVADIPLDESHPSYQTLGQVEENLARLRHLPTLLLWGEKDWVFTPHFLTRFFDFFPEATARSYPDCGHLLLEEAPERVIAEIEAAFGPANRP